MLHIYFPILPGVGIRSGRIGVFADSPVSGRASEGGGGEVSGGAPAGGAAGEPSEGATWGEPEEVGAGGAGGLGLTAVLLVG